MDPLFGQTLNVIDLQFGFSALKRVPTEDGIVSTKERRLVLGDVATALTRLAALFANATSEISIVCGELRVLSTVVPEADKALTQLEELRIAYRTQHETLLGALRRIQDALRYRHGGVAHPLLENIVPSPPPSSGGNAGRKSHFSRPRMIIPAALAWLRARLADGTFPDEVNGPLKTCIDANRFTHHTLNSIFMLYSLRRHPWDRASAPTERFSGYGDDFAKAFAAQLATVAASDSGKRHITERRSTKHGLGVGTINISPAIGPKSILHKHIVALVTLLLDGSDPAPPTEETLRAEIKNLHAASSAAVAAERAALVDRDRAFANAAREIDEAVDTDNAVTLPVTRGRGRPPKRT